jgi:hypothetical protein
MAFILEAKKIIIGVAQYLISYDEVNIIKTKTSYQFMFMWFKIGCK